MEQLARLYAEQASGNAQSEFDLGSDEVDTAATARFVKPILDVATRWNATYDMLVRALRLRDCLSAYAEGLFSPVDWAYYQRVVDYLEPFKECTLYLNGDKWVSISAVLPLYNKLIDHVETTLASMDADDDLYDAIEAAKQKLIDYYNVSSELGTAATLLDPQLKTSPFDEGLY